MKCTQCGCELEEVGNSLYAHKKAETLVPGNSLSGWVYTDTEGHVCHELWFGYSLNYGPTYTCLGYPHAGGDR